MSTKFLKDIRCTAYALALLAAFVFAGVSQAGEAMLLEIKGAAGKLLILDETRLGDGGKVEVTTSDGKDIRQA